MSNYLGKLQKKTQENYIENININSIVPSKIFIFELSSNINNDLLVDEIEQFKKQYPKSMLEYYKEGTFVRSWHSDYKTHLMTDLLDPLILLQKEKIKKIDDLIDVQISDMWINIYGNKDHAIRHNHGLFGLSTVYFPKVHKNPTPIIFDDNVITNKKETKIVPKTGMLLVFPSFLNHMVPEVSEESRISIAANLSVIRRENSERDPFSFQD